MIGLIVSIIALIVGFPLFLGICVFIYFLLNILCLPIVSSQTSKDLGEEDK